jgi:hypothetical protein
VLYVLENWSEIYNLGLKKFEVDINVFDIAGDDEKVRQIIRLNNAFEMLEKFSSLISPHIMNIALPGEDLNLLDDTEEFKEWIYAHHSTVFLLETYLGMLLSYQNAEKLNLQISDETIREEFKIRVDDYKRQLEFSRKSLPEGSIPLEASPIYTDFILQEIRDDLYKSKAYRNEDPLKPHEILLRFYEQYGYEGQRCEVREIYKWVRVPRLRKRLPIHEEYAASEEARVRAELNAIRDAVLAEGTESFCKYAITEHDTPAQQRNAGLIDPKGLVIEQTLRKMVLNEVSPVMNKSPYSLDLFWLAEGSGTNGVFYNISKNAASL